MNQVFELIEILGAFSFSISGALTAIKKKFDGFGIIIIAFVTAIGGGTVRDILISNRKVFWLEDPTLIYVILAGAVFTILFRSKKHLVYKPLMLFDAIGLGLFTITGVLIGMENDLHPAVCIILGTVTGTFGGITRDVLVGEIPIIFRKEIYATVSLAGGAIFFLLYPTDIPMIWRKLIPISFIILSRLLILKNKWHLPSIYRKDEKH